jgi:signal transduction histidine kinase
MDTICQPRPHWHLRACGEGLIGRVLATGQPVLLDEEHPLDGADTRRDACDTPIWIAVPITAQGKVQGALSLAVDPPRHCSPRDTAVLMLFARFCAAGLRRHPLLERARQAAAMEQHQAPARDLHESVTQTVFSLQLAGRVALDNWAAQPAQAREALEMVLHLALGASAEMRTLLFELRENALESEGLARALERYVDMVRHRSALPVELHVEGMRRLPAPCEEVLYRVAREALTNVVKHARATQARVVLAADGAGAAGEEGQRDQLAGVETAAGDVQRQHGAARVRSLVEEVPDDLVTCPLRLLPTWPMQKSLT